MKKQFTTIACILVAFILVSVHSISQEFALAVNDNVYAHAKPAPAKTSILYKSKMPEGNEPVVSVLNLSSKGLTALPEEVLIAGAEVVILDSNLLESLPMAVGQWKQCRQFSARHNWLEKFPEALNNLSGLESLDLTRNHIDALPPSVAQLQSLKSLTLDLNYLFHLPTEIAALQQLRELNIRQNGLKKLPASMGQLINLEVLSLTNNNLTELPEEIGNLKNLKVLRLDLNHIQSLPLTIINLKDTLKILVLKGNPLDKQWLSDIKAMLPNTHIEY